MNIVLVAVMYAPYPGGGAERVVRTQAEGLAARGHTVHVLTLGEPGSGVVHTELDGVRVVRVGIRNLYYPGTGEPPTWARVAWHARDVANLGMARVAREQIAALAPDIVVCHNIAGWSAAVLPAIRSLRIPVVQVLHDQYLRCVRSNMFASQRCVSPCMSCSTMRLPHRRLSRLPDAVVGVSRFVLDSHVEAGYFRDVPLRTFIHNVSHLDTRGRSTPPRTGNEIVFGFIGGLTEIKGIEPLLSAFRASAQPHWRLGVAGTGESLYVERLRAAYADPRIAFLGRQDPADFFLDLDATVVPSVCDEALGNVVFESLIHGRPVIGARRGGIPELLEDGVSGLLFDPDGAGALGRALEDFARSIQLWRSRQAAIAADAAPRYCDRAAWITRWEGLLQDVLDRRKPSHDAFATPFGEP